MPILIATVVALGLAVGSFLNVVIHRVPLRQSLVAPASHCPHCDHPIRARHNVPVFGWLALRGRCADCSARISVRYPAVELGTATLFAAATVQLAHTSRLALAPAWLFFIAVGIALAVIDLEVLRLPNAIVYPSYLVLAVLLGSAALVDKDPYALLRAGVGGSAAFGLFLGLALARPGGLGLGDVKLAGLLGALLAFLSWPALLIGIFAAFVIGAAAGVTLMITRGAGRGSRIAFGPYLIAGTVLALFVWVPVARYYGDLVHPA